jgi:hypothetical protein
MNSSHPKFLVMDEYYPLSRKRDILNQIVAIYNYENIYSTTKPAEVLPNLFVGGQREAREFIDDFDVIVSITKNNTDEIFLPDSHCGSIHRLFIGDYFNEYFGHVAYKAELIIREALAAQKTVLVQCVQGISRSVSAVLFYLICNENMTFNDAYLHLFRLRPIIQPNPGFYRYLLAAEQAGKTFRKMTETIEKKKERDEALKRGVNESSENVGGNVENTTEEPGVKKENTHSDSVNKEKQMLSNDSDSDDSIEEKQMAYVNCVPTILVRSIFFQDQAKKILSEAKLGATEPQQ